jgi:hypothetical protein
MNTYKSKYPNIYILTTAELLITLCHEIPSTYVFIIHMGAGINFYQASPEKVATMEIYSTGNYYDFKKQG